MSKDGPNKTLPIVVRKMPNKTYEIVDGEHRWLIAKELNWKTINALVRDVDDLQSRALCVSYNRLRGRLNWIKLHEVIKKDQTAGINLAEAYQEALSNEELEWLLSLDNLVPSTRLVLEQALKKYSEITLEQLYLLSRFPPDQQESLVERFKTPVVAQALTQTLIQFLQKNNNPQPPTPSSLLLEETNTPASFSKNSTRQDFFTEQQTSTKPLSLQTLKDSPNIDADFSQVPHLNTQSGGAEGVQLALLVAVSYECECGCHYRVNFKNLSVVVQKQNLLFEHADFRPCVFMVRCNKCNSDHEFTVEGVENDVVQIFCRRCKPPREGRLDVNAGEVTWFG